MRRTTLLPILALVWQSLAAATADTPAAAEGAAQPENTFSLEASGCLDRKFGNFTVPATHNSFCAPPDFVAPNLNSRQKIPAQLDAGVRFFEVDLHSFDGVAYCLHGNSPLARLGGARDPVAVFAEIVAWMKAHPNELVFIKFQETLTDAQLTEVMRRSGALELIYVFPPDADPAQMTPRDILKTGRRLITTLCGTRGVDSLIGTSLAYTPWNCGTIAELDAWVAPTPRSLLNMNAYVTPIGVGSPGDAAKINEFNFLLDFALDGWRRTGKRPHSIVVDFSSLGAPLAVVNELNSSYNAIAGRIVDAATNAPFAELPWENTVDDLAVRTTTHGVFSFPVKRDTLTALKPVKAGYRFEPPSLSVKNDAPYADVAARFIAVVQP